MPSLCLMFLTHKMGCKVVVELKQQRPVTDPGQGPAQSKCIISIYSDIFSCVFWESMKWGERKMRTEKEVP